MIANLWRRKLLFKAQTQAANNSNNHGGYERYNTEVDGQMHIGDAKITNLIGKHLQTKKLE
jgi:hypothetical protein